MGTGKSSDLTAGQRKEVLFDLPTVEEMGGLPVVAYHEAGHAVMASLVGRKVECATIEPEGMTAGHPVHDRSVLVARGNGEERLGSQRKPLLEEVIREVMVDYAGVLAQAKFTGAPPNPAVAHIDMDAATTILQRYCGPHKKKIRLLAEYGKECAQTELEQSVVWSEVSAVAEALLSKRTLNGSAFTEALQDGYSRWLQGAKAQKGGRGANH
jgi:hypothetical protein